MIDYLTLHENEEAWNYLKKAAEIAQKSSCYRSRCGAVIVKEGIIIGEGYNSPPLDKILDHCLKDDLPADFKSDRTCCVHAEQRAIMDALRKNPQEILGSRLYFIRTDLKGKIIPAGKPHCTICSKMALDAGISEFVLWHAEGIRVYDTAEYNKLSFRFKG